MFAVATLWESGFVAANRKSAWHVYIVDNAYHSKVKITPAYKRSFCYENKLKRDKR